MSRVTALLTPRAAAAAALLAQHDPATLRTLTEQSRRMTKASRADAADLASAAALQACALYVHQATSTVRSAVGMAVRITEAAAWQDAGRDLADLADMTTEDSPAAHLAQTAHTAPDAACRTTDRDRLATALALLTEDQRAALATMLRAEVNTGQGSRGDVLPASALSAAAGKVHSGRAKTAALALKASTLADLAAALEAVTASHQTRPQRLARWTDSAEVLADRLAQRPTSDQRITRDSMSRGAVVTSGPASAVLPGTVESRHPATQHLAAAVLADRRALPAWTGGKATEAAALADDTASRIGVHRSAAPVAGVTAGTQVGSAGTLAGTGSAQRPAAPRKRRRDGAVGGSMTRA